MNKYSVTVEYYDYFFTQSRVTKYIEVVAENEEEAKKRAYWIMGDLIDIKEVELHS